MRYIRLLALLGLASPLLLVGCAGTKVVPKPAAIIAIPAITAEPGPRAEPTLLERYQETTKALEAERIRNAGLENDLARERAARQAAEGECETLRAQAVENEGKLADLAAVKAKHAELQQTALGLQGEVGQLRDELLEARLTGARNEQALLAMKIEKAMENRRRALQSAQDGTETIAAETEPNNENTVVTP
jgi:hypothetical protein